MASQRKQQRRENAITLAQERAKRTPTQQLSLLDKRLGEGKGARKERAKLAKEISKPPVQKTSKSKKRI